MKNEVKTKIVDSSKKPKRKKHFITEPLGLLFIIVLIAAVCTYFVPAGIFDRVEDVATGRIIAVADSFHNVEQTPVKFFDVFKSIPVGMGEAGYIMFFLFIIGGAFSVMEATGAINVALSTVVKKMAGKETLLIPVVMFVFSVGGTLMGLAEETLAFLPFILSVCISLGFDSITAAAICLLGAGAGFAGATTNPFTIGVAQGIAGLPLFSGMGLRFAIYITLVVTGIAYVYRYAKIIKNDPTKSVMYEQDKLLEVHVDTENIPQFTSRHKLVLITFGLGMLGVVIGVMKFGFYIDELSAIFVIIAVVSGIIGGLGVDEIAREFTKGAGNFIFPALIVGVSRAITVVLTQGNIMDTIIYGLSTIVNVLPSSLTALGMYVVQSIISFIIPSGSGQAALTMPIMAPLADMVGVTRQTTVLGFQFADAFSNNLTPTSSEFMAAIALCKIPWAKWAKWFMPLFITWNIIAIVFILISVAIGYGPF